MAKLPRLSALPVQNNKSERFSRNHKFNKAFDKKVETIR